VYKRRLDISATHVNFTSSRSRPTKYS